VSGGDGPGRERPGVGDCLNTRFLRLARHGGGGRMGDGLTGREAEGEDKLKVDGRRLGSTPLC